MEPARDVRPDITGQTSMGDCGGTENGALYKGDRLWGGSSGSWDTFPSLLFKASKANSLYGTASSVRVSAIYVLIIIKT